MHISVFTVQYANLCKNNYVIHVFFLNNPFAGGFISVFFVEKQKYFNERNVPHMVEITSLLVPEVLQYK